MEKKLVDLIAIKDFEAISQYFISKGVLSIGNTPADLAYSFLMEGLSIGTSESLHPTFFYYSNKILDDIYKLDLENIDDVKILFSYCFFVLEANGDLEFALNLIEKCINIQISIDLKSNFHLSELNEKFNNKFNIGNYVSDDFDKFNYIKAKILFKLGEYYRSLDVINSVNHSSRKLYLKGLIKENILCGSGLEELIMAFKNNPSSSDCFVELKKHSYVRNIKLPIIGNRNNCLIEIFNGKELNNVKDLFDEVKNGGWWDGYDFPNDVIKFLSTIDDNMILFRVSDVDGTSSLLPETVISDDDSGDYFYEDEFSSECNFHDGYNGFIDNKLIDDALDGESEAYWNID